MHLIRTVLIAATMLFAIPAVAGAQKSSSLLERWYTALFDVNRVALTDLLAEDAKIELGDLEVIQTKKEFVEALDEWEEIAATANFAWQLDPEAKIDDTTATALVCYQFPENELLIREAFTFEGGKIIHSVQTTVDESCDEF
ncbi:nuclear transport factor 2 family protein [Hoeflea sp.]|jgi:hypothetical protein|uniref:nuclear transport factor 2 family protein n=1 Tax=Hoeflea sp. TaxID=1940281 RepID=UPI002AFDF3DB|nr:nuclear transport factor 2 family protein [Hoeflea sp.]